MSDAFYNALCDHQHFEGYEEGYKDGYESGKRDAVSPWHRVEDELPEIGKSVLVWDGEDCWMAERTDDELWHGAAGEWDRIENDMYWMPIEPPKEDA